MVNSCGCTRFPKKPPVDLAGMIFGKLTVLSEAERHVQKSGAKVRRWNCICECGKRTTVLHNNLTSPNGIRSCGCIAGITKMRSSGYVTDLTGNRYGWLIVISQAEPIIHRNGTQRRAWLCRCDCGREVIKDEYNLTYGHTRSCGCMVGHSIKGEKFGMLTAISKIPSTKSMRYWKCQCDCGNEVTVSQDDLFWGSVTDCGCVRQGKQLPDLAGQKFGKLTAIRQVAPIITPNGSSVRAWLCRCDCGREIVVRHYNLKNKVTRSCGCLRKEKARKRAASASKQSQEERLCSTPIHLKN